MKNECFIEGQINIFDLPVIEVIKSKEIIIKGKNKERDNLDSVIKLYSKSCSRIVKTHSGALLVELEDKTLYFNASGINELNLAKDVGIMPGEKTIVINPKGCVLEYNQKPSYHSNELINTEFNLKINEIEGRKKKIEVDMTDIEFKVDDEVNIEYQGIKAVGKVVRVYNNGETLNVK